MAQDADRLKDAASALDDASHRLEDTVRVWRSKVDAEVNISARGWKGPAAEHFWLEVESRSSRMRSNASKMRGLADQMRREAQRIEEEERKRREAEQRSSGGKR